MRITELFQVVPRFFLVVVAVALFGPGIDRICSLGLTSWPVLARVIRGEVLTMRELDFVVAARASGATGTRILWRELLPNVMPSAAVLLGLLFGQVILVEASLGFLGLGDPNAVTWDCWPDRLRGSCVSRGGSRSFRVLPLRPQCSGSTCWRMPGRASSRVS